MIYEIDSLSFSYHSSKKPVLCDVSLNIEPGDVVSILGRNGAGKSTLLSCMLGLSSPQAGRIQLMGRDIEQMSEREIACAAGYVPQSHSPSFSYSVLDFVMMGCASRIGLFGKPGKRERADALLALRELDIEDLADRPYTEISGGERQKATVARAVVSNPRAVLFDEPTSHLDYGNQLRVLRIIKGLSDKGYAVVMTTHNPDHTLLLGGKTALLRDDGSLLSGRTEDVVTPENLSFIYGTDVRLEHIESLGRRVCLYPNL